MALKRVCDITGTDSDVEICDVTIAGQTVKLDLSPAGVEKLREFFGPVVSVQHPAQVTGPSAASQGAQAEDAEAGAEQVEAETEAEAEAQEADEAEAEVAAVPVAAERPARRGRRGAGSAKSAPKKGQRGRKPVSQKGSVSRNATTSVSPDTSEIREWARANGFEIGERGAIPGRIRSAYTLAHE